MEKQVGKSSSLKERASTLENLLQGLPPLASDEYLRLMTGAPTDKNFQMRY